MLNRAIVAGLQFLASHGMHWYLSTSCLHGQHAHCDETIITPDRHKIGATCKFCATTCVCRCHRS